MLNDSKEEIGILKSIWRKSEEGVLVVHDIKGIDLKPKEGFSEDYYAIQNDLVLLTQSPGALMDNFFTSFGTTEFLVRQSIVPVVSIKKGDDKIRCIGTGFFISASGLLLTAAHVMRDPIDEGYASITPLDERTSSLSDDFHFGVLLPTNQAMRNAPFGIHPVIREARWFLCPFEWTTHWGRPVQSPLLHVPDQFSMDIDIAVCKVREQPLVGPYQPLNIGRHNLKIGDQAVAIGYAEMKDIQLGGDEYQPQLFVSVGSVTAVHHDNIKEKVSSTPGPNFEFDAKIPGKMSGAPILVGGGIITKGVVSRSWQDDRLASGCLIAPMMSLPVHDDQSLVDLMNGGKDGIPKIMAAGL